MANITVNIDGLTTGNPEAVADLMDIVGDSTKFDNVTSSNEVEYSDEELDNFESIFSDDELEEATEVQPDLFDDEFDVTYKNGRRVYDFHEINKAMETLLPDWAYTGDVYDGDELNLIYQPSNSRASLNKEMISQLKEDIAEKFGKDVRVRTGHSEYAPEQNKIYIGFLCDEGDDDVADEYKPEMEEEEELLTEKSTELNEDTVKQGSSWVNKGKEGTHGKFKTKKAADAQRKAMFAQGYKAESVNESEDFKDEFETNDEKIEAYDEFEETDDNHIILGNGYFLITAPKELVKNVCQSGDNENAATELRDYCSEQLNDISNDDLRLTVEQYGVEDVDSMDRETLELYIMWLLAWDACDNGELDNEDDLDESVSSVESDIADLIEDGVVEEGMTLEEQVESVCSLIGQKIDDINLDEIKARLGVKGNKGQQPNMKIKPTKDAKKEVDESVDYIGSRKVAMNPNRKFEQLKAFADPKNPIIKRAAYVVSQFDNGILNAIDANRKLDKMMAGMNFKTRSVFEANKKPEEVNEEYHSNPNYEDDDLDTYEYLYSLLINGNISQYKEKLSKMDRNEIRGYKAWANEMGLKEKSLKLEYANKNTNPSKVNRYEPISDEDDTNTYEYIWSSLVNGNFEQYHAQLKQLNNDEIKEYISWAEDMGIPYEDLHLEYMTESVNPDYMYNNQENKIAKGGLKPCQPTRTVKTINSRRKEYQGYCPKEDDLMRDKVVAIAESFEGIIKNTDEKLYPALQKRMTSKLIDAGASTKFARKLISELFK